MKTLTLNLFIQAVAVGVAFSVAAQSTNIPAPPPTPVATNESGAVATNQLPTAGAPAAPGTNTAPEAPRPADGPPGGELMKFTPPPGHALAEGEKGLRLNFRNAPLEMVLNYLSDAAGFVIIPEVEVRGRVDVWSNQPLTKDEAVDVLNSVLNRNGYAALRNGRTLTIVSKEEAKKRDVPVKSGSDPAGIPKSEEIVTQILPIKYINATQLTRDLMPLLPTSAQMTANEAGNSLVITDTQVNIRRMAEIIKALDTALSSVSSVKVFPLKFADAKSLATVIKDLFVPQQDASRSNDPRSRFQNFMRGREGGGPPGFGGGEGGGNTGTVGGGRAPAPRVVAVADERSNSLVVSAPEDQMPIIEDLVKQVDTDVEEITEIRVFHLKHADAQETAELLINLFPDPSSTQGGRSQFGGRGSRFAAMFGGNRPGGSTGADANSRLQQQTRVIAVPDLRTRSVVVSAARNMMEQIAGMIEELDMDPARKQKVFVFSVENTDPQAVQETLQSLFPSQNYGMGNSGNTRNFNRQTGNQLNNRANQSQNQGFGRSSGFGGSSGMGGGTGGSIGR